MDYGEDGFEMRAGGDFGNYATISSKNVNLRDDHIAEDLAMIRNDRGGGFVTRGFDSKNIHIIYYITFFDFGGNVIL